MPLKTAVSLARALRLFASPARFRSVRQRLQEGPSRTTDDPVRRLFLRHLQAAGGRRVLLAGSPEEIRVARRIIREEGLAGRFREWSPADGPPPRDVDLVVVVDADQEAARTVHAALVDLKRAGLPVVFGRARGLFCSPPTFQGMGLTYAGMWKVASFYLRWLPEPGDYVEFGVFDGRTFTLAWHALREVCLSFWAFDSFSGIGGARPEEHTHFRDGDYFANMETFRHNLRVSGVDESRVRAVPGDFRDTLTSRSPSDYGMHRVTIAHIDCDVYRPAFLALSFLTPVLADGALLLFDDYDQLCARNDRGERRALREWLEAHPDLSVEPYRAYASHSRAFILHRE